MTKIEIRVGQWSRTITAYQLGKLLTAADNGCGSGDFFVNDDGSDTGAGGKRALASYEIAYAVLHEAERRAQP